MKRRKIGIMGGTFNPIHNGHVALAQAAYNFCVLDEVWFMPSGVSYLKEQNEIVSGHHRLEMTRLAVQGVPYFGVSDMEIRREGYTYTVDTLCLLREMHPDDDFYFIMGADSLFGFPKWRESETIASLCTLVAVVRDDVDTQKLQSQQQLVERTLSAHVILVPFRKVDISSSDIREKIKNGENVADIMPVGVLQYIEQHELYK